MKDLFILVTGPKYSGKSLTALALGKLMGSDAVDLDELVEIQTGKKCRALFMQGPKIFRKAEAIALASLIRPEKMEGGCLRRQKFRIIAAGGGLIDNPEAMTLLSQCREIIQVYLEVSAETAWQRILLSAAGDGLPPFLNTDNPRETHRALHKRRCECYKALACFTISAENKSPDETAKEIEERLKTL